MYATNTKHATNILSPTYKITLITLKTLKKLLKKTFEKYL